jgi:2'-5' RNA ligase
MSELPDHVRAFVALKIPPAVIAELGAVQQKLKAVVSDASWTRPDAMHLTLHFFGNVASADLEGIQAALDGAAAKVGAFDLQVRGVGSFGNRVIWAGLAGDTAILTTLAEEVRRGVARFGSHQEDRAFNGHVTLGRLRRPAGGLSTKLRPLVDRAFGAWRVDHLELIRSELSPHGSRYTTLFSARLAG